MCIFLLSLANLCRYSPRWYYYNSAALSIDACQSPILSSPTFNALSCCAVNPMSCHFLLASDWALKPLLPEIQSKVIEAQIPCSPLQPQIKEQACPRAPLISGYATPNQDPWAIALSSPNELSTRGADCKTRFPFEGRFSKGSHCHYCAPIYCTADWTDWTGLDWTL